MTQPINSGAPQPVQGVTGGPPVLGGQIGNDPNSGNVVINPNPGNAVEIKKSPSAFNVYEYFNSNVDNVRLSLATALGGPEVMGVIAAPTSVNRDLQIVASGSGHVLIPSLQLTSAMVSGTNIALGAGVWTDLPATTTPLLAGSFLFFLECGLTVGVNPGFGSVALTSSATPSGGAGNPIVNPMASTSIPANSQGTTIAIAFIPGITAGSYKLQGYFNVAGATGTGRWSYLKVG
jgi:hypothetical protein